LKNKELTVKYLFFNSLNDNISVDPYSPEFAPSSTTVASQFILCAKASIVKKYRIMVQKARNTTLNVKDPEAHRLAQAIAEQTGETLTRAVTEALRQRYERLRKQDNEALAADIRAIAKRAAANIKRPYVDHAEYLYDERGLPK
jgi:antitoxin VapB